MKKVLMLLVCGFMFGIARGDKKTVFVNATGTDSAVVVITQRFPDSPH